MGETTRRMGTSRNVVFYHFFVVVHKNNNVFGLFGNCASAHIKWVVCYNSFVRFTLVQSEPMALFPTFLLFASMCSVPYRTPLCARPTFICDSDGLHPARFISLVNVAADTSLDAELFGKQNFNENDAIQDVTNFIIFQIRKC